jgi:hypothetical protein
MMHAMGSRAAGALGASSLSIILLLSILGDDALATSTGPPDAHTGAPLAGGGSELECTECHNSFPVDSGPGVFSIEAPVAYKPGLTYEIRVLLSQTGRVRWGFELTAIDDSLIGAGEFLAGSDGFSQVSQAGTREYVKQTSAGTADGQPDGQEWVFSWTAPATEIGPITLHAAGVAANSTGGSSGDDVYTTFVAVPEPSIVSLQLAACFTFASMAAVRRTRELRKWDHSRAAQRPDCRIL